MIKFVYFTDSHVQGVNFKSRRDYYPTTIMNKLKEVVHLANEEDAYLLCGGDLFHHFNVSISVVHEVMTILKELNKKPMFMVVGNHDIYGHNPDVVNKVILGLIEMSGLIYLLDKSRTPVIMSDNDITVQISGVSYYADIDNDPNVYLAPNTQQAKLLIHIVHGYLVTSPWPKHNKFTLVNNIKTNANLVLTGHEHYGYGVKVINGVTFCNPGALGRISASMGDMHRMPQVALISIDNGIITVTLRTITTLPGEQVLDRSVIEEEARREQSFINLQNNLRTEILALNLDDILEEVSKVKNVEPSIIDEAKRRISLVQERMADNV